MPETRLEPENGEVIFSQHTIVVSLRTSNLPLEIEKDKPKTFVKSESVFSEIKDNNSKAMLG